MPPRFWSLISLAWLDEMLRNFLWVPLTAYAKELGLDKSFLGSVFAVNVGMRFFPNLLVTRYGAVSEIAMMASVLAGYLTAFAYPKAPWVLHCLAVGAGMGFARPCVTLHAQRSCQGDMVALSKASRFCGVARVWADVCSFIFPAATFELAGWSGVTAFGAVLAVLYLVICLPLHSSQSSWASRGHLEMISVSEDEAEESRRDSSTVSISWIDWALSAAFVSTELQWNLLNTAMPAALTHDYKFGASTVGVIVGAGSLVTFFYLVALPYLPKMFNQHRPLNLLITYSGMSVAWLLMVVSLSFFMPVGVFITGGYLFLAMANASQIVMLECLTGVCNQDAATKVMGYAEMVGCALGMVGSYLGEALLVFGTAAPFIAVSHFSLLSTGFLAISLGRRRSELARRQTCHHYAMEEDGPSWNDEWTRPAEGLHFIFNRTESFISEELAYREKPGKAAGETTLEDEAQIMPRHGFDGGIPLTRIPSAESASSVVSKHQAKKLNAGFPFAYVDFDSIEDDCNT